MAHKGEPGGDTWNDLPNIMRQGGETWIAGSYDPDVDLTFWGASAQGPVRVEVPAQEAVSFVLRSAPDVRASRRENVALRTLDGLGVDAAYFRSQRAMQEERARLLSEHVVLLESDVKPHDRFLMERFITAGFSARGRTRLDRGVSAQPPGRP